MIFKPKIASPTVIFTATTDEYPVLAIPVRIRLAAVKITIAGGVKLKNRLLEGFWACGVSASASESYD